MTSWLDFEIRFRDSAKKLPDLRLDIQSGAAGEHFNLTGDNRGTDYRYVADLVAICGRLLERSLPSDSAFLKEKNCAVRWYRVLKESSGAYDSEMPGSITNLDGSNGGNIYAGKIRRFCEESANLCVRLEAEHPIKDDRSLGARLYADYGKEIVVGTILTILAAIVGLFFG